MAVAEQDIHPLAYFMISCVLYWLNLSQHFYQDIFMELLFISWSILDYLFCSTVQIHNLCKANPVQNQKKDCSFQMYGAP